MKFKITNKRACRCWFIVSLLFVVGIWLQSRFFLCSDVSWLLHATSVFLRGGRYYYDFFETNPPMILYIKIIPVLLAKYLHVQNSYTFKIFVFLIAFFSLLISSHLTKKIFGEEQVCMRSWFICALAFVFVILPLTIFGQREHIMLMLCMPYIMLAVLRIQKCKVGKTFAMLIGLLAGIGVAIKPYFILFVIFIEIYLIIRQRNLFSWYRLECIIIGIVQILFLVSIYIFTPEFYYKMLPLIWKFYYSIMQVSLLDLFMNNAVVLFVLDIGFFILLYNKAKNKYFNIILLLGLLGGFGVYVAQRTLWLYHLYPFFAFSFLLKFSLLQDICRKTFSGEKVKIISRYKNYLIIFSLGFFIFVICVYCVLIPFTQYQGQLNSKKANNFILFVNNNAGNNNITGYYEGSILIYNFIDRLNVKMISRFYSVLFVPCIENKINHTYDKKEKTKLIGYRNEIVNMVVEELREYQPDLLIYNTSFTRGNVSFNLDFVKYFSRYSSFQKIISFYRPVKKVGDFYIYKRIPKAVKNGFKNK